MSYTHAIKYDVQPATHAIGDQGVDDVLTMYEMTQTSSTVGTWRPRVEHVQHVNARTVGRMQRMRAVASVQPVHMEGDAAIVMARLGAARTAMSFPLGSMQAAGVVLACGSDWPVAPMDPLRGMAAAVTRPPPWNPDEALSPDDALRCYTRGGGYAARMERQVGSLVPGAWADLTVVDRNVLEWLGGLPKGEWVGEGGEDRPKVLRTYVAGKCEFGC